MTKQDARYLAQTVERLHDRKTIGRSAIEDALTLHRIAGSLHRYDERGCNEDLGCRECGGDGYTMERGNGRRECRACGGTGSTIGKRVANLEAKAREIADAYGFRAYFQGDCRGCPLYLIDKAYPAVEDESHYSGRGHAVPWLG